jgi:hypothetical protein
MLERKKWLREKVTKTGISWLGTPMERLVRTAALYTWHSIKAMDVEKLF